MLRQRRLAKADDALQLADRAFAFDQIAQHQQTRLAAHRAQQRRRRFGVGAEFGRIDRQARAARRGLRFRARRLAIVAPESDRSTAAARALNP